MAPWVHELDGYEATHPSCGITTVNEGCIFCPEDSCAHAYRRGYVGWMHTPFVLFSRGLHRRIAQRSISQDRASPVRLPLAADAGMAHEDCHM